jgi:hypothetical protein
MSSESDAGLDWIEWAFFLQTLSVERTEPFLRELALPFEREQFPDVMRLTRACLEAGMFRSIRAAEDDADSAKLIKAWGKYRAAMGVLDDEKLLYFVERYQRTEIILSAAFEELHGWIGAEPAHSLKEWFRNNFRAAPDPAWQWIWALRVLFTGEPRKVTPTSAAPVDDDERQRIKSFCVRLHSRRRDLESRFWVIKQASTATLPSLWESVLQEATPGGLGNQYPWLRYIEETLQLSLIRREWSKLKADLGTNTMTQLTAWVKQQQAILPDNVRLPDEPQ